MRIFALTKKIKILFISLLTLTGLCVVFLTQTLAAWEKPSQGIIESEVTTIAVHPKNSSVIFAGTSKGVYRSTDKGKSYHSVLLVRGSGQRVNALYASPHDSGYVYAATDSGLFAATNLGYDWKKIYETSDSRERQCLGVVEDGEKIYLATKGGLFYKNLNSFHWQKESGILGSQPVNFIVADSKYLYFSLNSEIFRMNKTDKTFERIFSLISHQTNGEIETFEDNGTEATNTNKQITFMHINSSNTGLYLVTTKGIYISRNQGESWERIDSDGLSLQNSTSLSESKSGEMFVGTLNGIFHLSEGVWRSEYQGMETNETNFLTHDSDGNLYAATNKGIFQFSDKPIAESADSKTERPKINFSHEPSIRDVQKIAIRYAEVDPEKILGWRRAAQNKAWFPTLAVGLDRDAADLLHWDTGASPDALLKGRDFVSWDVSLSWDLSDLVWSTDQTSIDSRSKLMVELREDVLDQVTRLYFERRRAQVELYTITPLAEIERVNREMRIEELTALIDGFTGGEFSRMIRKLEDNNKLTVNSLQSTAR